MEFEVLSCAQGSVGSAGQTSLMRFVQATIQTLLAKDITLLLKLREK